MSPARLGFLLVALLASTAAAQTIELAGPTIGIEPAGIGAVRAAGTASESLAVWVDVFDSLQAIRVDLLGRPIDERSLTIDTGYVFDVEVATDGTDYLVAYTVCTDFNTRTNCELRFASVARDGSVLVSRQRIRNAHVQSLAWTGEGYLLAYHTGPRIQEFTAVLALLDRRGFVLEDRILLGREPGLVIAIAPDGPGRVALAWRSRDGAFFAAGSMADLRGGALRPLRLTGIFGQFDVAASDAGYVVSGFGSVNDTFATFLIRRDGSIEKADYPLTRFLEYRAGATRATRFAVTAEIVTDFFTQLQMRRLDGAGPNLPLDPDANGSGFGFRIAPTSDGGAVIAWRQEVMADVVRVVRVTPGGTLLTGHGTAVNRGFVAYDTPVVRRCGDTFVAAWVEFADRRSVRYRRVTIDGAALDPPSRRATSPTRNDQEWPEIACTGGSILITWVERSPRFVRQQTSVGRGLLIDASGEHLLDFGNAADIYATAIGGEFVVVREVAGEDHEASRWSASGEQRTPWTLLFNQPGCGVGHGAIESNGEDLLIANVNACAPGDFTFTIARRYSADLVAKGRGAVFDTLSFGYVADIAVSPDGWLVAWGSPTYFGRLPRTFDAGGRERGTGAADGLPSAAWNGCAYELLAPKAIVTIPPSGPPVIVPTESVVRRAASDGPGRRLLVTIERAEEGGMRVVGRLTDPPRCTP